LLSYIPMTDIEAQVYTEVTPSNEMFDPQSDETQMISIQNALDAIDMVGAGAFIKDGFGLRDMHQVGRLVQRYILFRQLIRSNPSSVANTRFQLSLGGHRYMISELNQFVSNSERTLDERLDFPDSVQGEAGQWYTALKTAGGIETVKNIIDNPDSYRHPKQARDAVYKRLATLDLDLQNFAVGLVVVGLAPKIIASAAMNYMEAWNDKQAGLDQVAEKLQEFTISEHAGNQLYQWIGLDLYAMCDAVAQDVVQRVDDAQEKALLSAMLDQLRDTRKSFLDANDAKSRYTSYTILAQEAAERGDEAARDQALADATAQYERYEQELSLAQDKLEQSTTDEMARAWHTKLFDILLVLLPINEYERQAAGVEVAENMTTLISELRPLNAKLNADLVKFAKAQVTLRNYGAELVMMKGSAEDELQALEMQQFEATIGFDPQFNYPDQPRSYIPDDARVPGYPSPPQPQQQPSPPQAQPTPPPMTTPPQVQRGTLIATPPELVQPQPIEPQPIDVGPRFDGGRGGGTSLTPPQQMFQVAPQPVDELAIDIEPEEYTLEQILNGDAPQIPMDMISQDEKARMREIQASQIQERAALQQLRVPVGSQPGAKKPIAYWIEAIVQLGGAAAPQMIGTGLVQQQIGPAFIPAQIGQPPPPITDLAEPQQDFGEIAGIGRVPPLPQYNPYI
jgi:hypothetical protein